MMNKSAIKNYAVWARKELMKQVAQKAFEYGVTETSVPDQNVDSIHGRLLSNQEKSELRQLISQIKKYGYDHVIEEVAYTWFNRFIALRFMEVNNYLPQRIRVFTNENNEFKPELLKGALYVELEGLDQSKVFDMIEQNDRDSLYKYLLLCLCNDMKQYLPDMFTSIEDYKALLMPDNLLREDSVLGKLIKDIDEDSWLNQVQIIGWLYQYYNTELNNLVYDGSMSKARLSKDLVPAATTIYTPDWVVKYMVENSLGKLWIEGHPDFDHSKWKYYLGEAEQKENVAKQLCAIKADHSKLTPEDLKVIDPCMGSGHILVYVFDVLMDIYRSEGYSDRDAAKSILENNIYGLEIDQRAYQYSYFTLMMKARSYNRRILSSKTKVNVVEIRESVSNLTPELARYLGKGADLAYYLVNIFKDAKEYGSILNLNCTLQELEDLESHLNQLINDEDQNLVVQADIAELNDLLKPLIKQEILLVQKYDAIITNPPYLTSSRFSPLLNDYVTKNYKKVKSDLCMVMYKKWLLNLEKNKFIAFLTPSSWMFLSSFEKMRKYLLENYNIDSLIDFGSELFEGKVGHNLIVSWIVRNMNIDLRGIYIRLVDYCYSNRDQKEPEFFNLKNRFVKSTKNFSKIPGSPIAYWLNEKYLNIFSNDSIGHYATVQEGLKTANNDLFIRIWYEVDKNKFNIFNADSFKWVFHTKGGDYRLWYGNQECVLNYEHNGMELRNYKGASLSGEQNYFKPCITYNRISSANTSFRIVQYPSIPNMAGLVIYPDENVDSYYLLAWLNSKIVKKILNIINPTINFPPGTIKQIPITFDNVNQVRKLSEDNIQLSKTDWDSFETSWDFTVHPLVKNHVSTISEAYNLWNDECESRFNTLKSNEEELNRIFIDIYGLQDELTPEVEDKDVTVRKADLVRDIKSFISYAVGCMFGRYSLDVEGLAYAGGKWDSSKYSTFIPDADDIIPICDEEYFEDDVVTRFVEFVRAVYGTDTLEDNLSFIADALGGKGAPRDVLRNYFLNDFFKDHCNTYQVTGSGKRPIYWLFDSGKKNGFKALVYIHRYAPDLIARMRTGYIHPQQARYRTQVELLQSQVEEAGSTSERVRLNKRLKKISEQAAELAKYEEKVHHWADKMEPMDLDDGVKVNYEKFKDLLAKIK